MYVPAGGSHAPRPPLLEPLLLVEPLLEPLLVEPLLEPLLELLLPPDEAAHPTNPELMITEPPSRATPRLTI